jgi:hypothetical protein
MRQRLVAGSLLLCENPEPEVVSQSLIVTHSLYNGQAEKLGEATTGLLTATVPTAFLCLALVLAHGRWQEMTGLVRVFRPVMVFCESGINGDEI